MKILLLPLRFPLIVTVLFASAMYAVASFDPWRNMLNGSGWLAVIFLLCGLMIVLLSVWKFGQAGTTVNPAVPGNASKLVTRGIYAYSRNPMYVGFVLWLIGLGAFLGSVISLLMILLYIACIQWFYIVPEETSLLHKFGWQYKVYCQRVRRWI